MSSIDDVWASMQAETNSELKKASKIKSSSSSSSSSKSKKSKLKTKPKPKSKEDISKSLQLGSLNIVNPTDLPPSAPVSKSKVTTSADGTATIESGLLQFVMETKNINVASGDSDDEDDELAGSDVALPAIEEEVKAERAWSIQRFNSALNSTELQTRLQALSALHNVTTTLYSRLPLIPELDIPPPYDPSRIVLTHKQGAMVSDMAKGEHAPQWSLWQKTHSSLSSQFLADKSNEDLSVAVNEKWEKKTVLNDLQLGAVQNQIQLLLNGTHTSVFKRFSDTSEKCRELALQITIKFCLAAPDLTKCIPFLIPSILSRYPDCFFDQEQNVFIHDMEKHEEFKRGKATERQDKQALVHGVKKIEVVESSEEVPSERTKRASCENENHEHPQGQPHGIFNCSASRSVVGISLCRFSDEAFEHPVGGNRTAYSNFTIFIRQYCGAHLYTLFDELSDLRGAKKTHAERNDPRGANQR